MQRCVANESLKLTAASTGQLLEIIHGGFSVRDGPEPLTVFERARRRSTVRVAALETWLAATAGEARRLVIAHFAQDVTPDDLRAAYLELGSPAEELAELERVLSEPLPPAGPLHTPGPDAPPGALAFVTYSS